MPFNIDDLNKHAQSRFEQIKNKSSWARDRIDEARELEYPAKDLDTTKLQSMLDKTPPIKVKLSTHEDDEDTLLTHKTGTDEFNAVTNVTDFIDGLDLPPEASLAIAYIVTAYKQNQLEFLDKARKIIKEQLLLKGYHGDLRDKGIYGP